MARPGGEVLVLQMYVRLLDLSRLLSSTAYLLRKIAVCIILDFCTLFYAYCEVKKVQKAVVRVGVRELVPQVLWSLWDTKCHRRIVMSVSASTATIALLAYPTT